MLIKKKRGQGLMILANRGFKSHRNRSVSPYSPFDTKTALPYTASGKEELASLKKGMISSRWWGHRPWQDKAAVLDDSFSEEHP